MRVLDGNEAVRRIRKWEEATGGARARIVTLSAHFGEEAEKRSLAAGGGPAPPMPARELVPV